jgi:hypothetical protein
VLLSIWSYDVSLVRICVEFSVGVGFALYMITISVLSPCPPFLDSFVGPFLSVFSWVAVQSLFMRVRCLTAARIERHGQRSLIIIGALTQVGQLFGGCLIFALVNYYSIFKSKPVCVFDHHIYCDTQ